MPHSSRNHHLKYDPCTREILVHLKRTPCVPKFAQKTRQHPPRTQPIPLPQIVFATDGWTDRSFRAITSAPEQPVALFRTYLHSPEHHYHTLQCFRAPFSTRKPAQMPISPSFARTPFSLRTSTLPMILPTRKIVHASKDDFCPSPSPQQPTFARSKNPTLPWGSARDLDLFFET